MHTLLLMAVVLVQNPACAAAQAVGLDKGILESAILSLNMCSFPNSLRPRCSGMERQLRDFGQMERTWAGQTFELHEDGWTRRFTVLPSRDQHLRVCFVDSARNAGGSYFVRHALELVRGSNGSFNARIVEDTNCRSYVG